MEKKTNIVCPVCLKKSVIKKSLDFGGHYWVCNTCIHSGNTLKEFKILYDYEKDFNMYKDARGLK